MARRPLFARSGLEALVLLVSFVFVLASGGGLPLSLPSGGGLPLSLPSLVRYTYESPHVSTLN